MLKNSATHYGGISRVLHWSMVGLFAFQFVSIIWFRYLEEQPTDLTWTVMNAHKTAGLLILMVGIPRILWRRLGGLPDWHQGFTDWDKSVSHFAEYGLYGCIFAMTISGLLIELAGGYYVPFFGLLYLDNLAPFVHLGAVSYDDAILAARKAASLPSMHDLLVMVHVAGAYAVVMFLSVHVSHVIRHQRAMKDGLLDRMRSGGDAR